MRIFILSILLTTGLNMDSCSDVDTQLIFNKWVHSQEEKTEVKSQQIYRPADYKEFPASRFRQIFDFMENGICEYMYLHPTDKHSMKPGTWSYDEKTNLITIKDEDGKEVYSITLVELKKDKLLLIRN